MKKKILIVSHAMELGGVERSLLGLLDAMDYSKYDVDLFLLRHEGELLSLIPKDVNLLPPIPAYTVLARPMVQTLKEGHFLLTAARLAGKTAAGRYNKAHRLTESAVAIEYSHKYTKAFLPKIQPDTEYDLAVSFLTPHYFVAEKVRAKQKIGWIHTDYTTVQIDRPSEEKMWDALDRIVSISDAVAQGFAKVFPPLAGKLLPMENILPKALIARQAAEPIPQPMAGEIKLLSIGRFSHAKNFDNVPDICSRLVQMGLNVTWYLLGYGGDDPLIREKIKEAHMENHVNILGKKDNPYPYIKACDVYIQPSRYEGKCVAVREAQMLGKPVIITNYATSSSQLEDGVDGMVVPMDNAGCAQGIAHLLNHPEKMKQLSDACAQRDYTNASEVERIYQIMNT